MSTQPPPPTVVPIFATPFGVATLPDADALNSRLAALLTERATPDRRATGGAPGPLVYHSRDDLLTWSDEPARAVLEGIMASVHSIVSALNSFRPEDYASLRPQVRAWFTIVQPDGYVPATNYPNTTWCAIYCVQAPDPSPARFDSGVLRMQETRLGTTFPDATNTAMQMPYHAGHYTWRPVPGQVAIFPASVIHEIALLRSTGRLMLVSARLRFVAPGQTGVATW